MFANFHKDFNGSGLESLNGGGLSLFICNVLTSEQLDSTEKFGLEIKLIRI